MSFIAALIYLVVAAGFIASLPYTPYMGSFAVKAAPILLLFAATLIGPAFRGRAILCFAILFSAAGDVILDLGFQGSFIAGLVAFLIAHVWYIVLFMRDVSLSEVRILPTLLAIAYPLAMGIFLWPYLGPMKIPVAVYITVIASMLITAINRQGSGKIVLGGAVFFVISDSILALNKFYAPHPWARFGIMATYYAAQYLIVSGYLKEKRSN